MDTPNPPLTGTPSGASDDSDPPVHQRRQRYAGRNPRRFAEKYKEHQPGKYAADVARIEASGKTLAGTHRPVMVSEILTALKPQAGERAVDCTLGYGGHARELLAKITGPGGTAGTSGTGCLLGLDVDPIELPRTEERLRGLGFGPGSFQARHSNYAGLAKVLAEIGWDGADVILADLGVSSMQLDNPERGFTYKTDGPLDLRMNPERGVSAADWLGKATVSRLATALKDYADEPRADKLAAGLVAARTVSPLVRTRQLADVVRTVLVAVARDEQDACLRRVFQALRIAVNDEFSALDTWLRNLPSCLRPGGRVAVLTFHSGEDRRVKHAFRDGAALGLYSEIAADVIRSGPEEMRSNPRSASAKLRWAVRAIT